MAGNCQLRHFPKCTCLLRNGESLQCDFNGYSYLDHGRVTWSLLEPVVAMYYNGTNKVDCHQVVRPHRSGWGAGLHLLGMEYDGVVHPSRKSCVAALRLNRPANDSPFVRQNWTCDSAAFVVLLCQVSRGANASLKEKAESLLQLWLSRVCHLPVFDQELQPCMDATDPCCGVPGPDGVMCVHMAKLVQYFPEQASNNAAHKLTFLILRTYSLLWTCSSALDLLKSILGRLAAHIEQNLFDKEHESVSNALKVDAPRAIGGRRRVYDDAYTDELTRGLAKRQQATTGSAAARVEGIPSSSMQVWQNKNGVETLASCWALWEDLLVSVTMCLCEDATKLGKPAMEASAEFK